MIFSVLFVWSQLCCQVIIIISWTIVIHKLCVLSLLKIHTWQEVYFKNSINIMGFDMIWYYMIWYTIEISELNDYILVKFCLYKEIVIYTCICIYNYLYHDWYYHMPCYSGVYSLQWMLQIFTTLPKLLLSSLEDKTSSFFKCFITRWIYNVMFISCCDTNFMFDRYNLMWMSLNH